MSGQVGLSESKRAEDPPNGPKTMASYVTKQWALGINVIFLRSGSKAKQSKSRAGKVANNAAPARQQSCLTFLVWWMAT
jgi:hypothetical protein